MIKRFSFATALVFVLTPSTIKAEDMTPEAARDIAKEAYIYGYPLVENYRINYAFFQDKNDPNYKGEWNTVVSVPRVFTPADTAIQTPNSDTPYSNVGADLRAEPVVLTVPPIDKDRYFSLQFIDGYTFNFAYVGSRTTGNDGGTYLLAGPNWSGEAPEGITEVIRSETETALVVYRTQLFGPDDLENVKAIQAGYKLQTLSEFTGQATAAPKDPPLTIAPISASDEKTSLEFFRVLDAALELAPVADEEKDLRARLAQIGIGDGRDFDPSALSPEIAKAFQDGMADAWTEFDKFKKENIDVGKVTSGDVLGTREKIDGRWIYRMAGTAVGIYGNSREEAMYPLLTLDADGKQLDGTNNYTLTFADGQLPPAKAFWSITMYNLPQSLLVENPINRYLINSPMLDKLVKNDDGSLTLYIQNQSPGADREANWLPAPAGPFWMAIRIYWPDQAALDGSWSAPKVQRVAN